jgi:hypothetical protein
MSSPHTVSSLEGLLDIYIPDSPDVRECVRRARDRASPCPDLLAPRAALNESLERDREELERTRNDILGLYSRFQTQRIQYTCRCSMAAPIQRLPDEVLAEIFFALDEEAFGNRHSFWGAQESLVLSVRLTCRRWNQVVVEQAQFWTTINLSRPYGRNWDKPLEKVWGADQLQLWMSRSKNAPLSVELGLESLSSRPDEVATETYTALLKPLIAHGHRWRHLTVADNTMGLLSKAIHAARLASHCPSSTFLLPALEHLTFEGSPSPPQKNDFVFMPDFHAEAVGHLCLSDIKLSVEGFAKLVQATPGTRDMALFDFHLQPVPARWGRSLTDRLAHPKLTNLTIYILLNPPLVFFPFFRAILQGAPNLVVVELVVDTELHAWITSQPYWLEQQRTLPSVKYLRYTVNVAVVPYGRRETSQITETSADMWHEFLRWFPNLCKLDFLAFHGHASELSNGHHPITLPPSLLRQAALLRSLKIFVLRDIVFRATEFVHASKRLVRSNPSLRLCLHKCVLVHDEDRVSFSTIAQSQDGMSDEDFDLGFEIGDFEIEDDETWNQWENWECIRTAFNAKLPGIWDEVEAD